jgi:hypothetical protein
VEAAGGAPVCLADVATSAAAAIGVPGFADVLGIEPCQQVVVCLVDGLGWRALTEHADRAPALSGLGGVAIPSVFPTTTPVGLGSFGTGLMPGGHGLVGAAFRYPETDQLLTPLHWGSDPVPVAAQPEPTVFEAVARSGARMTTVSPGAYRDSGLTRAVLRGAQYSPAEDIDQRIRAVTSLLADGGRSFTYVYWPTLDRIGHEFGVDSPQWRDALARVDVLVSGLAEALVPGSALVVTADHGMVDCAPADRVQIEADPLLRANVVTVAGEPRARHLYVRPGATADVQAAWRSVLGDRALVLSRDELVEQGYFGPVDAGLEQRIGDVMAIGRGRTLLASHVDTTVSGLIGQHGALSDDELLIPAVVHRRS